MLFLSFFCFPVVAVVCMKVKNNVLLRNKPFADATTWEYRIVFQYNNTCQLRIIRKRKKTAINKMNWTENGKYIERISFQINFIRKPFIHQIHTWNSFIYYLSKIKCSICPSNQMPSIMEWTHNKNASNREFYNFCFFVFFFTFVILSFHWRNRNSTMEFGCFKRFKHIFPLAYTKYS